MSTRPHPLIGLLGALVASLAITPFAHAEATTTIVVKVADLVRGEVKPTVEPKKAGDWYLAVGGKPQPSCKVTFANTTALPIELKSGCERLFTIKPDDLKKGDPEGASLILPDPTAGKPPQAEIPFVLEAARAGSLPEPLTKAEYTWAELTAIDSELRKVTLARYTDKWEELKPDALPDQIETQKVTAYVIDPKGGAHALVTLNPTSTDRPARAFTTTDDPAADCKRRRAAQADRINVLCFVHQGSWSRLAGGATVMSPNAALVVLAYAPAGRPVTIEVSGDIGLTDPSFRDETGGAAHGAGDEVVYAPTMREWPALKPGAHTLTLTIKVEGKDDVGRADLAVDTPYAGAIRIGVGTIFGGARDRGYTAHVLPGSGQAEIVTTEGGTIDAELVLGIAAYLERGGRTYFTGERHHWAPYFGIGLLDRDNSAFELLRSVHLGLEYEISRQVSIAATVVGRKVDRLADGLEVGDPVTGTTVLTRKGYELGFGIVFNVSPEFLKIAKGKMPGFFK